MYIIICMYIHNWIHACAYVTDYYASLETDIIISRQLTSRPKWKETLHSVFIMKLSLS